MKSILCVSALMLLYVVTVQAQPAVGHNAILNAASDAFVGLPNSSIAQGSIFTIYGTNLGPSSSPGLSFPLNQHLGGVTVSVTSGGATVTAIPFLVSPNQINAFLPGNTPAGSATLTVAYNGQTSPPAPFQVVANSFGIFAVNSAGYGPGIITNTSYQVLGLTSAAHAGDAVIIWGTGLAASPGDDGTKPPQQVDLSTVPVTVYIGTQTANILYRGSAGFTGEDQIDVTIPSGITGCHVPVAVKIGDIVSNFVTMPIAAAGTSVCTDAGGPSTSQLSQFAQKGTVSFGSVSLTRTTTTTILPPPLGTTTSTSDSGSASFVKYNFSQLSTASNPFQIYTLGACTVITFQGNSAKLTDVITKPINLDAGAAITVNGPHGSKQLPKQSGGSYFASLGGGSPPAAQPLYLDAGSYTVSGPGGADVGAFSQSLTIFQPLTWTNQSSISTVTRSAGQLVTWTGGDPNGAVAITGFSFVLGTAPDGSDSVGAIFICLALDSAGQFNIPAAVLLSLPAGSGQSVGGFTIPTGFLGIDAITLVPFTAPGIDFGFLDSTVSVSQSVTYQ